MRDTPSRSTSVSSESRSPDLSSPERINSRSESNARVVCDSALSAVSPELTDDRFPLHALMEANMPEMPAAVVASGSQLHLYR
ncbi:MAG: hypothetical protein U1F67_01220 [Rubrivivax sp.]